MKSRKALVILVFFLSFLFAQNSFSGECSLGSKQCFFTLKSPNQTDYIDLPDHGSVNFLCVIRPFSDKTPTHFDFYVNDYHACKLTVTPKLKIQGSEKDPDNLLQNLTYYHITGSCNGAGALSFYFTASPDQYPNLVTPIQFNCTVPPQQKG